MQPNFEVEEVLDLSDSSKSSLALETAAEEALRINDPDVAVYAVIVNIPAGAGVTGIAYTGGACKNRPAKTSAGKILSMKTSVTRGPARGVVETAEVIQYSEYFFLMNDSVK